MKKLMFIALLIGLLCCCSNKDDLNYAIIENTHYDIPLKSQILMRIELTDSVYTKAQIIKFCESWVRVASSTEMKYHPTPTHIWVYIYKSKEDFLKDGTSWIAMYGKAGSDKPGDYTYR